ncbi:3-oxoacyl-[acyl-carrier-protein] reductase FabG-like [Oppia nitens]|uniref:3-oxoacyl-[acyl-carrier-protein] reductase FabG-like n=1 Tax=Oppia nitens TaxID=1686743 RepID=UPI0023DB4AA0|nr:3-oxoacyl-[acyl-carrier-protein] reductase FabG-like [Oppia nitens]
MSFSTKFDGKVCLVTGSSSGIGEETAIHLAQLGANVVVTGRDEQRIKLVAEKCRKISGKKVVSVAADLLNDRDVEKLFDTTIQVFGRLDVLVNNAGVGDLSYMSDPNIMEMYTKIMDTNLRCVVMLSHLAMPFLEKTKGCIINISSIASMKPSPKTTCYCMSKAALDMLTKCMSLELAPKGVRVNSINPAVTDTPLLERKYGHIMPMEKVKEIRSKQYPIGRIAQPYDIACAVEYLASEEASFITGINLLMDGGALFGSTQQQ